MSPVKLGAPTNWRSACTSDGETPLLKYTDEHRRMNFIALGTKLLRAGGLRPARARECWR